MSRTRTAILVALGVLVGSITVPTAVAAGTKALEVFITNTAANPVPVSGSVAVNGSVAVSGPVTVADSREPFEIRLDISLANGEFNNGTNFQVPAGKRLVVEFISASVTLPNGQTPLLSANANTGALGFAIPVQLQGVGNGNAFYRGTVDALDFAPAGFYFVDLERQNPAGGAVPGTAGAYVYLSGYLLPV